MNAAATPIATQSAGDVLPGDCCRINGCWQTVYGVVPFDDDTVTLLTESGDHNLARTAQVETAEGY